MSIGQRLFDDWTAMWNGDLAIADRLLAPGFRIWFGNAIGDTDTDAFRGPEEFVRFIAAHREARPGLHYALEGAAITTGDATAAPTGQVACRWYATLPVGSGTRTVSGIDILAFAGDRVTEAWSLTGDRAFATVAAGTGTGTRDTETAATALGAAAETAPTRR